MNLPLLLGSLVAVLATARMVAWLGLGRDRADRLGEEAAARLAEDLLPGFDSAEVFADRYGRAALVRGCDDSWALVRLQGMHPVARQLAHRPHLEAQGEAVRVGSGERLFGDLMIINDRLLTLV